MSNTIEILELCSKRLQKLDQRIDRLRPSVSHPPVQPSAPPPSPAPELDSTLVVDSIITEIMEKATGTRYKVVGAASKKKRAISRCHECHGPVRGYHEDFIHGLNICQLEHYDHCEGSILEGKNRSGHFWRGCPEGYIPPEVTDLPEVECLDTVVPQKSPVSSSEHSSDPDYEPSRPTSPADRDKMATRSAANFDSLANTLNNLDLEQSEKHQHSVFPSPLKKSGLGKSKEDLLLEAELAEIEVLKEREKKLELLKKARLEKQRMQENIERLKPRSEGTDANRKQSLHAAADSIRVRGQETSQPHKSSFYTGPDINLIRRDDRTKKRVDREMEEVIAIPALSSARPELLDRRGVPVPRLKVAVRTERRLSEVDEPLYSNNGVSRVREVSPRQDQRSEEILYKWVTCYDRFGEPHRTLVEHVVERTTQQRAADADSSRTRRGYRSPSPARRDLPSRSYQYRSRDNSSPPLRNRDMDRTPVKVRRAATLDDRAPRMDLRFPEDREGETLTLADHAKNLPVEFAKSATPKNMNFALWVYGAASELHSSLIGIAEPMDRDVLEAKLQHMMNVVHVTCLNSSASEYKPVSWSVGRTYHNLVQAKVDSGREHWAQFERLYRGSPHAAEMVSAEREHRTALSKVPAPVIKKDELKGVNKRICTTWNDSDVEGKCKYEAEHPGEKCNRQHSCSYCDKKGFTRNHHQDRFCKRKKESDK